MARGVVLPEPREETVSCQAQDPHAVGIPIRCVKDRSVSARSKTIRNGARWTRRRRRKRRRKRHYPALPTRPVSRFRSLRELRRGKPAFASRDSQR